MCMGRCHNCLTPNTTELIRRMGFQGPSSFVFAFSHYLPHVLETDRYAELYGNLQIVDGTLYLIQ